MANDEIHNRIEKLVAEEQELYGRVGEGGLDANEHSRLESIKVSLDQCWDAVVRVAKRFRVEESPDHQAECRKAGERAAATA